MKKLIAILATLAMGTGAMAADPIDLVVDVTTPGEATVSIPDGVLGIGLDVNVTLGTLDSVVVNGFNVYIDEASENLAGLSPEDIAALPDADTDGLPDAIQGTPIADVLGAGTAALSDSFALCAGYLEAANPGVTDATIVFTSADGCTVAISENAKRGGIVDATGKVTINDLSFEIAAAGPVECYAGQPDYDEWVLAGKPAAWCFPRQCHGDANGAKQGSARTGYYWVGSDDLAILASAWEVKDTATGCGITPVQAGADFDHARQGSSRTGYYRVGSDDLAILAAYWEVKEPTVGSGVPADCVPGNVDPEAN